MADHHFPNIADADRHAVARGDHNLADLLDIGGASHAVDEHSITRAADGAAADIEIVARDRLDRLIERQPVFPQEHRIEADLILLIEASPGVHLRRARNAPQGGLERPLLHRFDIRQAHAPRHQQIVKHLAQAGRHRPHLGPLHPSRHADSREPLIDELPGQIDIGAILECDNHHREAKHAGAAQPLKPRHAAHRQFDRKCDLPLDLLGHHPGSGCVDLHLHWRGVGKGIDHQLAGRKIADEADKGRPEQHRIAVGQ